MEKMTTKQMNRILKQRREKLFSEYCKSMNKIFEVSEKLEKANWFKRIEYFFLVMKNSKIAKEKKDEIDEIGRKLGSAKH